MRPPRSELTDALCVLQGASVLRMLEGFMGDEEFRQGISNFLKRFAYDNAVTLVSNGVGKEASPCYEFRHMIGTYPE